MFHCGELVARPSVNRSQHIASLFPVLETLVTLFVTFKMSVI